MAIRLDFFLHRMHDLSIAWFYLQHGIEKVRTLGEMRQLRQGLPLATSTGIPEPALPRITPPEGNMDQRLLDLEELTVLRTREVTARAVYVYAWAAAEELLQEAVREVYIAQPSRMMHLALGQSQELIRKIVVEGWDREQVVQETLRLSLRAYARKPFREVPSFFEKRLGVSWEPEWITTLAAIETRRNAAAHDQSFRALSDKEMQADVHSLRRTACKVAVRCATTHTLPIEREMFDYVDAADRATGSAEAPSG